MNDVFGLSIVFAIGLALGFLFYGALWLTVRRLPFSRRPVFLSVASFFARIAIVVLGFYVVMGGRWERLVVCLLGFLLMRRILVRRWSAEPEPSS